MFVQAAKSKFLRQRDIVGVFDLDTSTTSAVTKNFLGAAEKNGRVAGTGSLPKSFVLAAFGNGKKKGQKGQMMQMMQMIYLSANMTGYIDKFEI